MAEFEHLPGNKMPISGALERKQHVPYAAFNECTISPGHHRTAIFEIPIPGKCSLSGTYLGDRDSEGITSDERSLR